MFLSGSQCLLGVKGHSLKNICESIQRIKKMFEYFIIFYLFISKNNLCSKYYNHSKHLSIATYFQWRVYSLPSESNLNLLNSVTRHGVILFFSWSESSCFHQMFKPVPISLLASASLFVLTSFLPSLSDKSLFYLCCSRALIHPMCSARSILSDGDRCNWIGLVLKSHNSFRPPSRS